MEGSPLTRYLRIAVTALSLTACLLLIALWVRNDLFWHAQSPPPKLLYKGCVVSYKQGRIQIYTRNTLTFSPDGRWVIQFMPQPQDPLVSILGIQWNRVPGGAIIRLPYWLLVSISAVSATVLAFPKLFRFSLRTLLIAMTLIAVVLGIIISTS